MTEVYGRNRSFICHTHDDTVSCFIGSNIGDWGNLCLYQSVPMMMRADFRMTACLMSGGHGPEPYLYVTRTYAFFWKKGSLI